MYSCTCMCHCVSINIVHDIVLVGHTCVVVNCESEVDYSETYMYVYAHLFVSKQFRLYTSVYIIHTWFILFPNIHVYIMRPWFTFLFKA